MQRIQLNVYDLEYVKVGKEIFDHVFINLL